MVKNDRLRALAMNGAVVSAMAMAVLFMLLAPLDWLTAVYGAIPFWAMAMLFGVGAVVSHGSYLLAPMPVVRNFMWICTYGAAVFVLFAAVPDMSSVRQAALARLLLIMLVGNGVYAHFIQRLRYVILPLYEMGAMPHPPAWAMLGIRAMQWWDRRVGG